MPFPTYEWLKLGRYETMPVFTMMLCGQIAYICSLPCIGFNIFLKITNLGWITMGSKETPQPVGVQIWITGVILRSSLGPTGPPCSTSQWTRNHLIFPHFDDLTSEAPLTVGVHFQHNVILRLSGNHFGSSHPTHDQSATARSRSVQVKLNFRGKPKWFPSPD